MRRHILSVLSLVTLTTLLLALPSSTVTGQPVPGAATRHRGQIEVLAPQAELELVQVVLDFVPGSMTPRHLHGGQAVATVLSGELTRRVYDPAGTATETVYRAGDSFLVHANEPHEEGNTGTALTSVVVTYLLAKGAALTTPVPVQP